MAEIDTILHQPVRLRIMAALTVLPDNAQMEFVALRNLLRTTDGNLGAHLHKLENAGYISVEKAFVSRKPHTFISITAKGRSAFDNYVQTLQEILGPIVHSPEQG